mmetsp:Transcript_136254/g.435186  ORF Transcript_136254/g.435186 Transcript_136254/m.435186 type:complete len:130 (-) Transcript_136254:5-394(-)
MSNLAVLASCRGRGVGRRLIWEAEEQVLARLRLREVALMVNAENDPARRLYESLGYSQTFEDRWAMRAVASAGGTVEKVRVHNLGYSRNLGPVGGSLWSQMAFALDAVVGAVQAQMPPSLMRGSWTWGR